MHYYCFGIIYCFRYVYRSNFSYAPIKDSFIEQITNMGHVLLPQPLFQGLFD